MVTEVDGVQIFWQKPPMGFVKCNVDATFHSGGNKVGFGTCLRDGNRNFIAAKMCSYSPIVEVYNSEALGLLLAMEWVRELHFKDATFELDAKVVVDDFNNCSPILFDYGCILNSCKKTFKHFSNNSHVEFFRRETNRVAHTLTGVALFSVSSQTIFDIPTCISDLLLNDMK